MLTRGSQGKSYSVQDLADADVKRISVGGSFARVALGALVRAVREVRHQGTFSYAEDAIADREIAAMMSDAKPPDCR